MSINNKLLCAYNNSCILQMGACGITIIINARKWTSIVRDARLSVATSAKPKLSDNK